MVRGFLQQISRASITSRRTPVEAVVYAEFEGVFVIGERRDHDRRRPNEGDIAEVVILIFKLDRPVRDQHVFDAAADRVSIVAVAVEAKRPAGVSPCIAALGGEQRWSHRVTKAASDRSEVSVAEESQAAVAGVDETIIALDAEDQGRRKLVVHTNLATAHELGIVVAEEVRAVE